MSERLVYLVIGHLTPTDADPDPAVQGKLDEGVSVLVAGTREQADEQLLWYQDGVVREIAMSESPGESVS